MTLEPHERNTEPEPPSTPDLSEGHIGFDGNWEYYRAPNGDIARADRTDPVMPDGRRFGRFESTATAWENNPLSRKLALESPEGIYLGRELMGDDGQNWDKGNAVVMNEYRIRKLGADDPRRLSAPGQHEYALERRPAHRNDQDGLVPHGEWQISTLAATPDALMRIGSATRLDEVEDPVLRRQYDDRAAAAAKAASEAERKRAEAEALREQQRAEHQQWLENHVAPQRRATKGKKQDIELTVEHKGQRKVLPVPATVYGDIAVHRPYMFMDGEMKPQRGGGYRLTHVASGRSLHDADTLEDARMAAIAFHHGVEWTPQIKDMPQIEIEKARNIKRAFMDGAKPAHINLDDAPPMRPLKKGITFGGVKYTLSGGVLTKLRPKDIGS
ncbi:MAG: hypothetical protein O3C67_08900 [Cyanobacteria bacterium]|nr:hypothetical protein [Cyanobacteriota bacterium]